MSPLLQGAIYIILLFSLCCLSKEGSFSPKKSLKKGSTVQPAASMDLLHCYCTSQLRVILDWSLSISPTPLIFPTVRRSHEKQKKKPPIRLCFLSSSVRICPAPHFKNCLYLWVFMKSSNPISIRNRTLMRRACDPVLCPQKSWMRCPEYENTNCPTGPPGQK